MSFSGSQIPTRKPIKATTTGSIAKLTSTTHPGPGSKFNSSRSLKTETKSSEIAAKSPKRASPKRAVSDSHSSVSTTDTERDLFSTAIASSHHDLAAMEQSAAR
ncbi:hypothetical protein EON65_20105 [archaeon]|nr:MAG: hypothetical protein EON65_20105 [archaeon]